jgi:hypothetical protein
LVFTQPLLKWIPGSIFLGVKWPVCTVPYTVLYSAKVKNEWRYTSTSQRACLESYLVRQRYTGRNALLNQRSDMRDVHIIDIDVVISWRLYCSGDYLTIYRV